MREYTKAEVLQLFEAWADLAADKKIPDPHRFDTALVEWCKQQGYTVKSFNAPIFLIFAAFVGRLTRLKSWTRTKKRKPPPTSDRGEAQPELCLLQTRIV